MTGCLWWFSVPKGQIRHFELMASLSLGDSFGGIPSCSTDTWWRKESDTAVKPYVRDMDRYKSFRKKSFATNPSGETEDAVRTTCAACILTSDGQKCLLVKQRDAQKWSLPKGTRETDENTYSCMQRELEEETGLVLSSLRALEKGEVRKYRCHVYLFRLEEPESQFHIQPRDQKEIECAQWMPISEMGSLSLNCITAYMYDTFLNPAGNRTKFLSH